jgi:hypothetical protein
MTSLSTDQKKLPKFILFECRKAAPPISKLAMDAVAASSDDEGGDGSESGLASIDAAEDLIADIESCSEEGLWRTEMKHISDILKGLEAFFKAFLFYFYCVALPCQALLSRPDW